MALSEIDRTLLARCLANEAKGWNDFVDRFMGLVIHVINHTAQSRSMRLTRDDRDDLASDVFLEIVKDDFGVLRNFRGESSLATYLTVISRRVVVAQLLRRRSTSPLAGAAVTAATQDNGFEQRISDRDQVARLIEQLEDTEAEIVRLYHLEGKSYLEISSATGMPENSVGPTLSRAREKMRRAGESHAAT